MSLESRVESAIYQAIDELNCLLPPEQAIAKSPQTILFGQGGSLDSLGLVNLIVAAERYLEAAVGGPVSLADERAMSQRNSPFRSVRALTEYVCKLVGEPAHA
jgi:D-alanine--poly(phosphoribitol) ligase subunit 2